MVSMYGCARGDSNIRAREGTCDGGDRAIGKLPDAAETLNTDRAGSGAGKEGEEEILGKELPEKRKHRK